MQEMRSSAQLVLVTFCSEQGVAPPFLQAPPNIFTAKFSVIVVIVQHTKGRARGRADHPIRVLISGELACPLAVLTALNSHRCPSGRHVLGSSAQNPVMPSTFRSPAVATRFPRSYCSVNVMFFLSCVLPPCTWQPLRELRQQLEFQGSGGRPRGHYPARSSHGHWLPG